MAEGLCHGDCVTLMTVVAGPGQPPYLRYQANYKVPQQRADVLGLEGGNTTARIITSNVGILLSEMLPVRLRTKSDC